VSCDVCICPDFGNSTTPQRRRLPVACRSAKCTAQVPRLFADGLSLSMADGPLRSCKTFKK
jgi:hypothetical protein